MDKLYRDKKAILLFMLPACVFFIAIVAAPIFLSLYYSTLNWDGMGEKTFIGFDNYIKLFTNVRDKFLLSIRNSSLIAILSLLIQVPLGLVFALVLSKGIKGERTYITIFFIPVIISTVAIGQLWGKIYHPEYGLLNTILRTIGLESWTRPWLGDVNTVLGAVFVPIIWQYIGYYMLLFYSAIKSISADIFEAAKIDGASGLKTAFLITIPLIKPMIRTCVIFSVIGSFKTFDLIYVLTEGGPAHASEVPTTLMVWTIFKRNQYGYGSAMAVIIVLICFLLYYLIQKFFKVDEIEEGGKRK